MCQLIAITQDVDTIDEIVNFAEKKFHAKLRV